MRALTLTQPYCGLVASGIKLIENRKTRVINPRYLGQRIALHASGEIDLGVTLRIIEIAPELCTEPSHPWWRLANITSAVIGVAIVERIVRSQLLMPLLGAGQSANVDDATGEIVDLGDQQRWYFGPVGYVLRDVRALAEPVSCDGHQWFWELPAKLEQRVVAQLSRAA